jgi:hypothetical protein
MTPLNYRAETARHRPPSGSAGQGALEPLWQRNVDFDDSALRERAMKTYDAHKNTTEVRQGNRRTMNARVLIISIAIVIAAFAIIFLVFSMQPNPTAI